MAEPYTPDLHAVRNAYIEGRQEHSWDTADNLGDEFDRWLAAHDAEVHDAALVITDAAVDAVTASLYALYIYAGPAKWETVPENLKQIYRRQAREFLVVARKANRV